MHIHVPSDVSAAISINTIKYSHPEDFLIKAIKTYSDDLSNLRVEDVILGKATETFDVSDVGVNCREIVLVVTVLTITKEPVSYSFSVSLVPDMETILDP